MSASRVALLGRHETLDQAAVFLDRDGVINVDTGYIGSPDNVALIEGVAHSIAKFNSRGIPVICVTNQSGIFRGYYTWEDFMVVTNRIDAMLASLGAHIDAVFASGEGPGGEDGERSWRKPSPGMFLAAAQLLQVNLRQSIIVGDKISDIVAGQRAGLRAGALVACKSNDHAQNARGLEHL